MGYASAGTAREGDCLTRHHVCEIEIGRKFPSIGILQKLADALRVKPYQLFFDAKDKTDFDKNEAVNSLYADVKACIDEVVQKHLR